MWWNRVVDGPAVLLDLYGRIPPLAASAVEGLDAAELRRTPGPGTNSIGWLVWHMARVQDHQISELLEAEQLYLTDGWADRFDREPDPWDIGFGHTPEQVASVQPDGPQVLLDYLGAAQARTEDMLRGLRGDDLDDIVDENWDPPVTRGVRLVSVADDCLQHVGQACYLRGLFAG